MFYIILQWALCLMCVAWHILGSSRPFIARPAAPKVNKLDFYTSGFT